MLGNLTIKVKSFMDIASKGVKIQISDVFLCLEMLEVKKWSQELVINKYQDGKRNSLQTLQDNTDIFFANMKQEQNEIFSIEYLQKIAANTSIEIENVFLMYEDKTFQFSIGLLLPKIEVTSMNHLWNKIEEVVDTSVIFKTLTISNVSLFINSSKQNSRQGENDFESIDHILKLSAIKDELKFFDKQDQWKRNECQEIGIQVKKFIKNTFQDSELRFSQQYKNKHVFLKKLSIELKLSVTLNKTQADLLHQDHPNLLLILKLGGLQDASDEFLSIFLQEKQIYSLLHLTTFFNAFSNYSQGVAKETYMSKSAKVFEKADQESYLKKFNQYLEEKQKPQEKQKKIKDFEVMLWDIEKNYRTDVLLRLRQAQIQKFYEDLRIKLEIQKERTIIDDKNVGWLYGVSQNDKKNQILRSEAQIKNLNHKLIEVEQKYQQSLQEIEKCVLEQFDENDENDIAFDQEAIALSTVGKFTKIEFEMPKLELNLIQNVEENSKSVKHPLCTLELKAINISLEMKTMPDEIKFKFEIDSLQVQDKMVRDDIIRKNNFETEQKKNQIKNMVSEMVIQTAVDKNSNYLVQGLLDLPNETDQSKSEKQQKKLITVELLIKEVIKPQQQSNQNNLDEQEIKNLAIQDKEMKTEVNVQVNQQLIIFGNFYFIQNLLLYSKRIVADMNQKRQKLIYQTEFVDVKKHIELGLKFFQFLEDVAIKASKKYQKVKQDKEQLKFSLNLVSPKLIIDEYLFAEKVFNTDRSCYFLFDMGVWHLKNGFATDCNVEKECQPSVYNNIESTTVAREKIEFETFDMQISDIQILYNFNDYQSLLEENPSGRNFTLCEKFTFGLQYQTLISAIQDLEFQLPRSQLNLKFMKLRLNLERDSFRQLIKVKTYLSEGTYLDNLKTLTDELTKDNNDSKLKNNTSAKQVNQDKQKNLDLNSLSSMRVNLKFSGVEVRGQNAQWNEEQLQFSALYSQLSNRRMIVKTSDILSVEASDFMITVHMRDKDKQMSVLVLLDKLQIQDKSNGEYYFKNLVKVASDEKEKNENLQDVQEFTFDDFKDIIPRQNFFGGQQEVAVHYSSSEVHFGLSEDLAAKIKRHQGKTHTIQTYSQTIIKIQHLELIAHFQLIKLVLQTVYDTLFDLNEVERIYTDHIMKNKKKVQDFGNLFS